MAGSGEKHDVYHILIENDFCFKAAARWGNPQLSQGLQYASAAAAFSPMAAARFAGLYVVRLAGKSIPIKKFAGKLLCRLQ
ncbi:hypothetical protein [Brenneria tiliae]|uniref:hypothetical protein n=1 Tax=Brenneria tiliae TaxID=2914984 RepID=UPI002014B299|nr:hypothetical protein [Brenneria tiliae]MCL2898281.1 hypothetical protein [Brenneria tiliae]MCL2902631.1 hypothetical protein [Brenneria tiliae]